jgi:hypothetical protein
MNRPNLNLLVDHDFNLFKGPNGSLKLPPQNVRNSDGLHFHYHSNPEIQDGYRDGKSAGYVVEPRTAHA